MANRASASQPSAPPVAVQPRTPGIAPGQAVVAYRPDPAGDIVLGSATIASTVSAGVAA